MGPSQAWGTGSLPGTPLAENTDMAGGTVVTMPFSVCWKQCVSQHIRITSVFIDWVYALSEFYSKLVVLELLIVRPGILFLQSSSEYHNRWLGLRTT